MRNTSLALLMICLLSACTKKDDDIHEEETSLEVQLALNQLDGTNRFFKGYTFRHYVKDDTSYFSDTVMKDSIYITFHKNSHDHIPPEDFIEMQGDLHYNEFGTSANSTNSVLRFKSKIPFDGSNFTYDIKIDKITELYIESSPVKNPYTGFSHVNKYFLKEK